MRFMQISYKESLLENPALTNFIFQLAQCLQKMKIDPSRH